MLTLRPSLRWKVLYVVFLVFFALYFAAAVPWDRPVASWELKRWGFLLFALVILFTATQYPRNFVTLEGGVIRDRIWFHLRTRDLPPRVAVTRGLRIATIVMTNADDGQVIIVLARDFDPTAHVEGALRAWLRKEGRLAELRSG